MKKIVKTLIISFLSFSYIANAESFKDYAQELTTMKDETNTYNCMKIMKNIDNIKISYTSKEKLRQKIANNLLNIGKMSRFNQELSELSDSNEITENINKNFYIYQNGNNSLYSCNQLYQYIINKKLM